MMGDSRGSHDVQTEIVKQICGDNPQAVFHTGDIVSDGNVTNFWNDFFPVYDCLMKNKNVYLACGNHEKAGCVDNPFRKALGNEKNYFTVDLKGFTFIVLDSVQITAEELRWLSSLPTGEKIYPAISLSGLPASPRPWAEWNRY